MSSGLRRKSEGRISVTARLIPPPLFSPPPKSKPAIPPNRALPLRRSKAMAGACAPTVMRSSVVPFADVPSPSSPIRVDPLRVAVRTLKPWLWYMCNEDEISYIYP
jgi:hypothetical protein